ncbi:MAG TPA: DUF4179 domain-containing protein, partial [Chloroflexi bacterium]|nr:DUF4179 domain-containing protein [Chloroflexota bacterium]
EGIAEDEVPTTLDLWPAIRAQIQPRRGSSRRAHRIPVTRLGWAGLLVGALLLFGGIAYALNPALGQVFRTFFPGWQHIEEAHLAQESNLSQAMNGVTVTLERAYADANQIVIGYTVKGLADQNLHVSRMSLTDEQGRVFSQMAGAGMAGTPDIPPGEGAYVTAFDASVVEDKPESLHLHLTMHLVKWTLVKAPTATLPEPSEPGVIVAQPQTLREEMVGAPFTFDFSVPFIPGQTVEVQQAVEAAGVTMKLKRVVITPSETRAILCFEPPDDIEWTLLADLDAGDGGALHGGVVGRLDDAGGQECHRVSYMESLTGRSGLWTLTVTELVGTDLSQIPSEDVRLAGPWVFRFRVP